MSELGMKCNAICCSSYSDYTSENRTNRGAYNTRKFLLGTSLCPKVGNNSEKAHIKYDGSHFVMSSASWDSKSATKFQNPPNAFHSKSSKHYTHQYFPLYGNILHM